MKTPPDLTLRAYPGRKPLRVNRRRIVAVVTFGLPDGTYYGGYCHPYVEIGPVADADDEGDFSGYGDRDRFTVRFQQHRPESDQGSEWCGRARGWTFPGREGRIAWSKAYGGRLDSGFRIEDLCHVRWAVGLLQKAATAAEEHRYARAGTRGYRDGLIALVVGLRLIGVEVRVYNERIRAMRERRAAERASGTMREAA